LNSGPYIPVIKSTGVIEMSKLITCTCSDLQLEHVGCDCVASREAVIVRVWLDGYASDNTAKMVIDGGQDPATVVRAKHGGLAIIFETRRVFPERNYRETFSPEYIREMSIGG
jgi:hypothetical protein